MHAKLKWVKNMQFECDNNGHKVIMDILKEHGGDDKGPTPKDLLLDAMMGCTAMDTTSLLKKMRQNISKMEMEIDAVKTTEHPVHFESAVIKFLLHGEAQNEKIIKAIDKSLTKYCGVNYIVSQSCDITYEVYFNDEKIHTGKSIFDS